jgi:hypothetical protein
MAEEKLNIKQQLFIKEYIANGGDGAAAWMKVYKVKDKNVAAANASRMLSNANLQEIRQRMMEHHGLTDGKIFKKVIEQMEATKPISCNVYIKKDAPTSQEDGEMAPANGCTKDFIDVPDNQAQLKAVEIAAKLKGMFNRMDDEEQTIPVKLTFKVPANWRPKE